MQEKTVGVFMPSFTGFYFASIHAGIDHVVQENRANLVSIQTNIYIPETIFDYNLATNHVDGWICVIDSITPAYKEKLWRSGKPFINISSVTPGVDCPVVQPDNRGAMATAVNHLIAHGHQRIAFVGCLEQGDIQERFEGYKMALAAHNIPFDQKLVFPTKDNVVAGGSKIGFNILRSRTPFTGMVVGTDLTALGIMEILRTAGRRVPEDIAIIGFDDINEARYSQPPLSSTHQSFFEIGRTAARLVIAQLDGAKPINGPVYVPTSFIQRGSCGCTTREKEPSMETSMEPSMEPSIVPDLYLDEIKRITPTRSLCTEILRSGFDVAINLFESKTKNQRDLSWLRSTPVTMACLGIWAKTTDQTLLIDRTFNVFSEPLPDLGTYYTLPDFPPQPLFKALQKADEPQMMVILPIALFAKQWGFLAIVYPSKVRLIADMGVLWEWYELMFAIFDMETTQDEFVRQRKLELESLQFQLADIEEVNDSLAQKVRLQQEQLRSTFELIHKGLNEINSLTEEATTALQKGRQPHIELAQINNNITRLYNIAETNLPIGKTK